MKHKQVTVKNDLKRGKQINCQNEPSYSHHETVVFSIRFPDVYMNKDCEVKQFKK